MSTFEVGVIGGSGYIGAELLRYLSVHPQLRVRWVTANSKVSLRVDAVLPNLLGFNDLTFQTLEDGLSDLEGLSAVFVALPHNKSQEVMPEILNTHPDLRVIDMGGDFRTNDLEGYQKYYGREHAAPELLESFCYGFTEFQRDRLKATTRVANPGCFATSLVVGLSPLAKKGSLKGRVAATGITGSSGSGNVPKPTTHHPERTSNLRAYKILNHQHLLEVTSFLNGLGAQELQLDFVPQSGPIARGIFTTIFLPGYSKEELAEIYDEAYSEEPLIHVQDGSPDLRLIQGTPQTLIGINSVEGNSVVIVALDNLGKGAASQAIQNLNQMLGLEETAGLKLPGGFV